MKLILSLSAKREVSVIPVGSLNVSFPTKHSAIFFSISMNTKKLLLLSSFCNHTAKQFNLKHKIVTKIL